MGNCKNSMKNKWFLVCFRREKSLRTNAESERNIFLHQKTSIPLPNDQKNIDPCPDDVNDGRKSPRRRRFRRVFERIISNTPSPLSKKKRNNKGSGKEACNKVSSKFLKIFNTSSKKKSKSLLSAAESFSILSSHSSMFSPQTWDSSPFRSSLNSSSSSSSPSFSPIFITSRTSSRNKQTTLCMDKNSSSIPKLEKEKEKKEDQEEEKDGNCSSPKGRIGLYFMIVISLVGLIFWGEALAILCTSICLFLFSFINGGVCLKENGENDSTIDIEYKRKVVMEGIPERRNSYIP